MRKIGTTGEARWPLAAVVEHPALTRHRASFVFETRCGLPAGGLSGWTGQLCPHTRSSGPPARHPRISARLGIGTGECARSLYVDLIVAEGFLRRPL